MPFEKGHKLGKGRPKGSRNKIDAISIPLAIEAVRDNPGSEPLQFIASIIVDETQAIELRLSAAKELAKYTAPQLKAVEHTIDGEASLVVGLISPRFGPHQEEKLINDSEPDFL